MRHQLSCAGIAWIGWGQRRHPESRAALGQERGGDVRPHLWDELEERVREQRADGQRDEKGEDAAEKRLPGARDDEEAEQ